ncbi:MAG: hypothetical protein ABIT20_24565 [Gemmatimonadaceae bacterium]
MDAIRYGGLGLFVVLLTLLVHVEPIPGRERIAAIAKPLVEWGPRTLVLFCLTFSYILGRGADALEKVVDAASQMGSSERRNDVGSSS